MPTSRPTVHWNARIIKPSLMVTGRRSFNLLAMSWPSNVVPRCPWARLLMKYQYCATSGWSRWNCARFAAITDGASGLSPASCRIGSPCNANAIA
jgi:hypothetical protein